jgi:hypothetical protein
MLRVERVSRRWHQNTKSFKLTTFQIQYRFHEYPALAPRLPIYQTSETQVRSLIIPLFHRCWSLSLILHSPKYPSRTVLQHSHHVVPHLATSTAWTTSTFSETQRSCLSITVSALGYACLATPGLRNLTCSYFHEAYFRTFLRRSGGPRTLRSLPQ